MKIDILDALLGEHAVLYSLFTQLEGHLPEITTREPLASALAALDAALVPHARVENEVLFPALEARLPPGPVGVMRHEHEDIEGGLAAARQACEAGDVAKASNMALDVLSLARVHFSKEEQVLFRMARDTLSEDERTELGGRWAAARGISAR